MRLSHWGVMFIALFLFVLCPYFILFVSSLDFFSLSVRLSLNSFVWLKEFVTVPVMINPRLHLVLSDLENFIQYLFNHFTVNLLSYFNSIHLSIYFHPSVHFLIGSFHFFMSWFCRLYNTWWILMLIFIGYARPENRNKSKLT